MTEEEKKAAETAQAEADAQAEDDENEADAPATEDESEEDESEDEVEAAPDENEIDLDAEIEAERKKGVPDKKKAAEAFNKRKAKNTDKPNEEEFVDEEDDEIEEDDDDKPMTRREAREFMETTRKAALETQAFSLAKQLASSDKEAELIVLKWQNRSFPPGTTLNEQIHEAFAVTHSKRLIKQREEAIRALNNKDHVNRNGAGNHQTPPPGKEPKMRAVDAAAIKASGFTFNNISRRFEKKLPNGKIIFKDKNGKVKLLQ